MSDRGEDLIRILQVESDIVNQKIKELRQRRDNLAYLLKNVHSSQNEEVDPISGFECAQNNEMLTGICLRLMAAEADTVNLLLLARQKYLELSYVRAFFRRPDK